MATSDTIPPDKAEAGATKIRPTKRQYELLAFIEEFITQHGYSPSYREIMSGLNYTSVATVALHVNNLIKRGHLRKRDHSARSLELTKPIKQGEEIIVKRLTTTEEKWLIDKIEVFFKEVEQTSKASEREIDQLYVLIGALKVLGLDGAAQSFMPRLSAIKSRGKDNQFSV